MRFPVVWVVLSMTGPSFMTSGGTPEPANAAKVVTGCASGPEMAAGLELGQCRPDRLTVGCAAERHRRIKRRFGMVWTFQTYDVFRLILKAN